MVRYTISKSKFIFSGNNMYVLKKVTNYCKRLISTIGININYYLGSYRNAVWIIGDGRSGTTWLSDIINWEKNFREMFEPFHPNKLELAKPYALHQYMRVNDDSDHYFAQLMNDIFTGRLKDERVDKVNKNIFYNGLLIKDIFGHLIASWVQKRHPNLKIVLLMRNPFEVALSKENTKDWMWMEDPKLFLEQKELYEDFLQPFEKTIRNVSDDYIERQIMIWAIIHYVLFQQIKKDNLHIVFYENLVDSPKKEITNLMRYIHNQDNIVIPSKLLSIAVKPSRVASKNRINGKATTNDWKGKLTSAQLDNGLKILSVFKLDKIYGEDFSPSKQAVENILK